MLTFRQSKPLMVAGYIYIIYASSTTPNINDILDIMNINVNNSFLFCTTKMATSQIKFCPLPA